MSLCHYQTSNSKNCHYHIELWTFGLNQSYFIPKENPQIVINTTSGDKMNFVVHHATHMT